MSDQERFPYVPVKNARGETALRPQLPLTFTYHEQAVPAVGLLDTGADVSVMPYHLGLSLGIVWSEQTTAVELSGNLAKYVARGIILSAKMALFPPVQLVFAWTQTDNVPLILGQVNFFMEFDVCFYRSQALFEVQPRQYG